MLVFPYSNKALKVLLEICQLQLDAYMRVGFRDAMLLYLTIAASGKKKKKKQKISFANDRNSYNLIRELFIAAPADP